MRVLVTDRVSATLSRGVFRCPSGRAIRCVSDTVKASTMSGSNRKKLGLRIVSRFALQYCC